MHLLGYLVPSTIAAGIVVSAAAELIALVFLADLILLERDDEASARFACWALAVFPYAVYLTAVYLGEHLPGRRHRLPLLHAPGP